MFYSSTDKFSIHLEITDKCNAACAQCGRNKLGGETNPFLPDAELSLEDFKKIIPPEFVKKIKRLYMCGNYGDPVVARETLEIFEYLRDNNSEIQLGMNTNGSARDSNWWNRLGKVFGQKGNIKFGIDGLFDTNHIYRRKTQFNKIIENAKSFIDAGGRAHWEYIVFKHNEHQVERAREFADEIGFEKFTLKKTGRFFSNTKVKTNEFQQVLRSDGELDYIIEKPTSEIFQNKSLQKEFDIVQKFGSMNEYLDKTPVDCKVIKESSFYISSEGLIFPCCWTANQLYLWYMPANKGQIWDMLNANGGKSVLDGRSRPVEEILSGSFFESLKNCWTCNSVKEGKPKVCAKTCGTLFDQFSDQYK